MPKLVTQLRQHAHNWKVTHPKTPFPGELALFADLRTPNRALAHLLASAKTTGYRRVHLMTFRPELTHSAVLGEIRAQRDLAVAVDLVDGAARGTTLDLAASYQSLARAADQANGAGRRLRLRVP